jgi:hypothetical protein
MKTNRTFSDGTTTTAPTGAPDVARQALAALTVLTVLTVLLIAAAPGRAEVDPDTSSNVAGQDAPGPAAAATEGTAEPAASQASRAQGIEPAWQPPVMPEPAAFAAVNISPEKARELAYTWGVEVLGVRLTAADMMLDFRFRVLDAQKALPLFDHRIAPHVIAERSNVKLPVPMAAKVGAFRPTNRGKNIKPDKIYYMIFGNPDRHVKAGEQITVVIGGFMVEHLLVN